MPDRNIGAMRALPPALLGQGAGGINVFRMLGGAFGTNLLSVRLDRRTQHQAEGLNASVEGGGTVLEARRLLENLHAQAGLPEVIRRDAAQEFLGPMVEAEGLMLGLRDAFILTGIICLLAVLPGLTLRQKPPGVRV